MSAVDLDGLRRIVRTVVGTAVVGDDCDREVLDFYAWQDAREVAEAFILDDEQHALAELLANYARGRIPPVTVADVELWLTEFQDPEAIGMSRQDLVDLVVEWRKASKSGTS